MIRALKPRFSMKLLFTAVILLGFFAMAYKKHIERIQKVNATISEIAHFDPKLVTARYEINHLFLECFPTINIQHLEFHATDFDGYEKEINDFFCLVCNENVNSVSVFNVAIRNSCDIETKLGSIRTLKLASVLIPPDKLSSILEALSNIEDIHFQNVSSISPPQHEFQAGSSNKHSLGMIVDRVSPSIKKITLNNTWIDNGALDFNCFLRLKNLYELAINHSEITSISSINMMGIHKIDLRQNPISAAVPQVMHASISSLSVDLQSVECMKEVINYNCASGIIEICLATLPYYSLPEENREHSSKYAFNDSDYIILPDSYHAILDVITTRFRDANKTLLLLTSTPRYL